MTVFLFFFCFLPSSHCPVNFTDINREVDDNYFVTLSWWWKLWSDWSCNSFGLHCLLVLWNTSVWEGFTMLFGGLGFCWEVV